jgi:peptide/nickel transport system permease protein
MQHYILRRTALNLPVLLLVVSIVFLAVRAIPGDYVENQVAQQFFQNPSVNRAQALHDARQAIGLDRPLWRQYLTYVAGLAHGDLGHSYRNGGPALRGFGDALPVSLQLGLMTLLIAVMLAFPIGILSAIRQDTAVDYGLRVVAVLGLAAPSFWIATIGLLVVAKYHLWSINLTGNSPLLWNNPGQSLKLFIIPAIAGGLHVGAVIMRMLRSEMLEVLRQDYIRTAWSKGIRERRVVLRHALRNAMIPVITIMGLTIGTMIGGQIILETIFNLRGVGRFALDAIQQRDYPVIQAFVLVTTTFILFTNLVVDVSYAWFNPNIRYS